MIEKRPAFSPIVVAFRLVLLLSVAGAAGAAAWLWMGAADRGSTATAAFVCPMHPEVRSASAADRCPICGMALEPLVRGSAAGAADEHHIGMVDTTAVENIRKHKILDFVRKRSLLLLDAREMRGAGWVDEGGVIHAVFYRDQVDALAPDEAGTFFPSATPSVRSSVRRLAGDPQPWDPSTVQILFSGAGTGPAARPAAGAVGWVELGRKARDVVAVPSSALLPSPDGPYVLVPLGGGRFEKRAVEVGETFLKQGFAVVLAGLKPQDRVLSRATFFLDADRRAGTATGGSATP